MRSRALGLAVVSLLACKVETPDKPEAPDMSAVVDAYANVTANFDEQTAADVVALLEDKVALLVDLDSLRSWVEEAVASLGDREPQSIGVRRQSLTVEGDGFLRIERICTGFGQDPPIDRDANGYLDLTAGFTDAGLDPVIWGAAVDCKQQLEATELAASGVLNLYVGDNLALADVGRDPILFELADFSLRVDGEEVLSGGFDFQVCQEGATECVANHVELLLRLAPDRTIVFFVDYERTSGGFRAANGLWTCDFEALECSDGAGSTVAIPEYQL